MDESLETLTQRLYLMIHRSMAVRLPAGGGIHIYSNGATILDFNTSKFPNFNFNQPYSAYMLGFDKNGKYKGVNGARIPKPKHKNDHPYPLERYNFDIIRQSIVNNARNMAVSNDGRLINLL